MRLKELSTDPNTDRGASGGVPDTRTSLTRASVPSVLSVHLRTGVFCLNCGVTWLQQTFSEADKNRDGTLSIGEVHQLLHKLNVNLPKQKVRQMFQVRSRRINTPATSAAVGALNTPQPSWAASACAGCLV